MTVPPQIDGPAVTAFRRAARVADALADTLAAERPAASSMADVKRLRRSEDATTAALKHADEAWDALTAAQQEHLLAHEPELFGRP